MPPSVFMNTLRCVNNNLKVWVREKFPHWFRPADFRNVNFFYSQEDKMPFWGMALGTVYAKYTLLLPSYALSPGEMYFILCYHILIILHIKQKYLLPHHHLFCGAYTGFKFPPYQGPWVQTVVMDPSTLWMQASALLGHPPFKHRYFKLLYKELLYTQDYFTETVVSGLQETINPVTEGT